MRRGQASLEYLLLIAAILLGACVLVQHLTPVAAVARAVEHALAHHPHRPPPVHVRHGPIRHHRPAAPRPCLCPSARAAAGTGLRFDR